MGHRGLIISPSAFARMKVRDVLQDSGETGPVGIILLNLKVVLPYLLPLTWKLFLVVA